MLAEDMLDAGDLVLRFALGKLRGLDAAVEDRAVVCELGNVRELLGVLRMGLRGGWCWWGGSFRSTRGANGLKSTRPCRQVRRLRAVVNSNELTGNLSRELISADLGDRRNIERYEGSAWLADV